MLKKLTIFLVIVTAGFNLVAEDNQEEDSKCWYPNAIGIYAPLDVNERSGHAGIVFAGQPDSNESFRYGLILCLIGESYKQCDISGFALGWQINAPQQIGLQIAGTTDCTNQAGLHLAFANTANGSATGQIGILASGSQQLNGVQIAGLVVDSTNADGVQVAGIGSLAGYLRGVQIAGLGTINTHGYGIQIALCNVTGMELNGFRLKLDESEAAQDSTLLQIGLENLAGKGNAFQIGLINQKSGKGFQIGLLNYSEESLIPYMILLNW